MRSFDIISPDMKGGRMRVRWVCDVCGHIADFPHARLNDMECGPCLEQIPNDPNQEIHTKKKKETE